MVYMGDKDIQKSRAERNDIGDFDMGLAIISIILAVPLGLAIDYGHWWLGVPAGVAVLLLAGVFARRHVFKGHPKPLTIGLQRDTKTSQP